MAWALSEPRSLCCGDFMKVLLMLCCVRLPAACAGMATSCQQESTDVRHNNFGIS